jgi:hypothetical protein
MSHTFTSLRRPAVAVGAAVAALTLAACGGSTGPSSAAASGGPNPKAHADFLKFSECMRAHGITNFPDPNGSGGIDIGQASGLDPRSPAFQTAQQACMKLLPGGGPGAHPLSAAQRRELIANAQCMRTHGVPNFPDPNFQGGGVRVQFGPGTGINPQSPAFQNAARQCKGIFGGKGGFAIRIAG